MQRRRARRLTDESAGNGRATKPSDTSSAETVLAQIEAILAEA